MTRADFLKAALVLTAAGRIVAEYAPEPETFAGFPPANWDQIPDPIRDVEEWAEAVLVHDGRPVAVLRRAEWS